MFEFYGGFQASRRNFNLVLLILSLIFIPLQLTCMIPATATAHCLLFLAQHPNYQNKVVEEINEFFGDNDEEITLEALNKLQYMDRVIKETMRIAPIGPVIFREAMEDFEIEEGLVIPKGTTFILNIYALHRAPHIWGEHATVFDPDNFLPENITKRHPCAYIPFSTGYVNLMDVT
jgi:cytochrome P450